MVSYPIPAYENSGSSNSVNTPEPFKYTVAPFHNELEVVEYGKCSDGSPMLMDVWKKVISNTGPFSQYEYGTITPRNTKDDQHAAVCTPTSKLVVVDVDNLALAESTAVYQALGDLYGTPTVTRSNAPDHQHWHLDYRAFPHLYPKQKHLPWGDVKANGFVPLPGSKHYSGGTYDATGDLYVVTLELAELIFNLKPASTISHAVGSDSDQDGSAQEPRLLRLTGRLMAQGASKEDAWEVWLEKANEYKAEDPNDKHPAWLWSEKDRKVFNRHWAWYVSKGVQEPSVAPELLSWAQNVKSPGQGLLNPSISGEPAGPGEGSSVQKSLTRPYANWYCEDLHQPRTLLTAKSIDAVILKERNSNVRSIDWASAPDDARKVWELLANRRIGDLVMGSEPLQLDSLDVRKLDPEFKSLNWVIKQKYLIRPREDGSYDVLGGRERGKRELIETRGGAPFNVYKYPGMPDDVHPRGNGHRWTLDETIEAVVPVALQLSKYQEVDPDRVSYGEITCHVNQEEFRQENGLSQHNYLSTDAVGRAIREAKKRDLLHCALAAEAYVDNHAWAHVPPSYAPGKAKPSVKTTLKKPVLTWKGKKPKQDEFVLSGAMKLWAHAPGGDWSEKE